MYGEGGGAWLPPTTNSCWGASLGGVFCWGMAWLPPSTNSGWGATACVVCCGGGTWLPLMRYSGCRTASASVCCGNGGGRAGNRINGEDALGCWTGVSAHS